VAARSLQHLWECLAGLHIFAGVDRFEQAVCVADHGVLDAHALAERNPRRHFFWRRARAVDYWPWQIASREHLAIDFDLLLPQLPHDAGQHSHVRLPLHQQQTAREKQLFRFEGAALFKRFAYYLTRGAVMLARHHWSHDGMVTSKSFIDLKSPTRVVISTLL
jgi:hypothetical protein